MPVHYVSIYLIIFGIITIAGGVIGFLKAKSKASLIAGGISGVALCFAGEFCEGPNRIVALAVGFVVSLALTARFGNAYRQTKKPMPAGLIALLGIGGVVMTLLGIKG